MLYTGGNKRDAYEDLPDLRIQTLSPICPSTLFGIKEIDIWSMGQRDNE